MRIATRIIAALAPLFYAAAARAQDVRDDTGLTSTAQEAGFVTQTQPLTVVVGNFISGVISLLGALFVVLMVYGGFLWMMSQGEKDKITKAKGIITSAAIGLVVIFASYAIAQAVIGALATSITPGVTP